MQIDLISDVQKKSISITVKDKGMGISEEDQKHLFEMFYRAQNATTIQGTGLGLNIVKKYVAIMNGTIDIKSKLDKGTSITIKF